MKRILISILLIAFIVSPIVPQIKVEKTIPEKIELSDIREFVINVSERTINVHLENGRSYVLLRSPFMAFWNGLTATQRNIIKGFIKQCTARAAAVDQSKVTGEFGE